MTKRVAALLSISILTLAAIAIVARSGGVARADATKTPWKITGQLEVCRCVSAIA